jgi:hypothetical protein
MPGVAGEVSFRSSPIALGEVDVRVARSHVMFRPLLPAEFINILSELDAAIVNNLTVAQAWYAHPV